MNCAREAMRLYAVTDRQWLNGRALAEDAESALKGGVTMLQLREKELSEEAFLEEAFQIKALCAKYRIPFIINDNVEVALACDADGIHVGQSDMDALHVREKMGPDKIVGVSAQTVEQAVRAEESGADYLGVGAVFQTSTKGDADAVSADMLRAITGAVSIPVCAIGGIYESNMLELSGTGIDGVALVSAIFAAKNIEGTCRDLRELSEAMVNA